MLLTLISNKTTIHEQPMSASYPLVAHIFLKRLSHICIKVFPFIEIPSISFTWDVTIMSAAADVKPDETGPEIKSIRNPETDVYSQ